MTPREMMMRKIQQLDFSLVDAGMYLNGHPKDPAALSYFKQQQKDYQQAILDYTNKYGPITFKTGMYNDRWTWIDGPWPWEGADN